jgi:chromosome partitioning protein
LKRIAFVNQKGGVGKTTTAINLAGFLAQRGRDVLLVDLDPQGNATTGLGIDRDGILSSIYEVLMEGMPAANAIRPTSIPGLKMIPSSRHLPGCEIELTAADNREFRLFNALQGNLQPSTYILIDCPPSLGLLTLNGLVAAQSLIIPLQAEFFALEGLSQLLQTYHLVRANLNPTLHIEGILLTMYDNRTNLAREVEAEIVNYFSGRERVFKSKIPRNIRLAEAPSHGLPISHYAAGSLGALAYSELAEEVISSVEKNLLLKQDNDSPSTNHAKPFVASALAPNPPLDI